MNLEDMPLVRRVRENTPREGVLQITLAEAVSQEVLDVINSPWVTIERIYSNPGTGELFVEVSLS